VKTSDLHYHQHQWIVMSSVMTKTKGRFLDLNWPGKLVLTDRFAQLVFPVALTNGQNGQKFDWPKSAS